MTQSAKRVIAFTDGARAKEAARTLASRLYRRLPRDLEPSMNAVNYSSKDGTEVSCEAHRTPDGKFRPVIAITTRYGSHKDESGETFGSYEEAQKMAHAWALRRYPAWQESKV